MIEVEFTDSRYHRQELITWWDQSKLLKSKVLVVGAGAIGNEVVKNLSMVGVGFISIVDMDSIENSNLARCVFFREEHNGMDKATVLAEQAMKLNPEVKTESLVMPVQRLGVNYLRQFDIIIGALDNREARAWVNQASRKIGKVWIDAAIEGLRGLVRTFMTDGSCYECTLSDDDYKAMSHRRSCALLAPHEILSGKTPTNATTAGVVAGVQVQEAIKFLVGRKDLMALGGKVWVYTGDSMTTYVTRYEEDEDCLAHDFYEDIESAADAVSISDLVSRATQTTGEKVVAIDFEEDLILVRGCKECGIEGFSKLRSAFGLGEGLCSSCGKELVESFGSSIEANDTRSSKPLSSLGLPISEIITIRTETKRVHYGVEGSVK
jgi:molybdopterin/thiamine biosynthesis adenylyltransferase